MNKTYVNLQGGLGNQLFIYFYGNYFAEIYQKKIMFLCNDNDKLSKVGLNIDGQRVILNKHLKNFLIRLFTKISKFNRLSSYIYMANDIGYEELNKDISKTLFISGYFQSPIYIVNSKTSNKFISDIRKYLNKFQIRNLEINYDDSIAIHIRRGDYLDPPNSYFGILSSEYYKNSISMIMQYCDISRVFMFSDSAISPEFQSQLKAYFPSLDFIDMENKDFTDIETLSFLTQFKYLVISNSTFAWWGAFLNVGTSRIICPTDWFKDSRDPNRLYPTGWQVVRSSWGLE
jgi:hypothetical protein